MRGEKVRFSVFSAKILSELNCTIGVAGNDPTLISFPHLQPETPSNAFFLHFPTIA